MSVDFAYFLSQQDSRAYIRRRKFEATFLWLNETNADYFCPKIDPKWDGTLPSTLFVDPKKQGIR